MRSFYLDVIKYLSSKGWKVSIITSEDRNLNELSELLKVNIFNVSMQRSPAPIKDVKAFLRIYKIIIKVKPTIVMSATPKASLLTITASFLAGCKIRIYQVWGLRFESTNGVTRQMLILAERFTAILATVVVSNSQSLKSKIIQKKISNDVKVIGNGSSHGVNFDYFDVTKKYKISNASVNDFTRGIGPNPLVLFAGRISKDKGIEILLKAHELAFSSGRPFYLLIIGQEEDFLVTKLIDSKTNQFLCRIGNVGDIRPYLSIASVLCLPSRREGFPNVVLEAAAMKVAAVVSDATGCIDSVIENKTGLIFPVDNIISLEHSIQKMLEGRKFVRFGENAYVRAKKLFSQEKFLPKIEIMLDDELKLE